MRDLFQEGSAIDDIAAAVSMHGVALLAAARAGHPSYCIKLFEAKFGAVKRQRLPSAHNGAQYSRLDNGTILLQPEDHLHKNAFCDVPDGNDDKLVTGVHAPGVRSLLTSMLFLRHCNGDACV